MARPMPLVSPCAPWLCRGTSTPTGLARAATTRLVALRATTSMASSITPTGSTIYSSPPPWEGENYEPRNPMESATLHVVDLDAPIVLQFLDYLEHQRGNAIRSRNMRLAAIRS